MRLLVVDDEPNIVRLMVKHLTRSGFEVETAGDGAEALTKIQVNPPDVLVCDVMMPVMGGFELCSILLEDERLNVMKIVLLTNCAADSPRPNIQVEALSPGIIVSLTKPVHPTELLFAVNEVAGIKQPEWMPEWLKPLNIAHPNE